MPTATDYEMFVAYKLAADSNDAALFDPTSDLHVGIITTNPDHTDPLVKLWTDVSGDEVNTGGSAYTGPFPADSITLTQIGATENIRLDGGNMTIAEDASGFTDGLTLVFFSNSTGLLMFKQVFAVAFGNTFAQLNINVHANGYWDR